MWTSPQRKNRSSFILPWTHFHKLTEFHQSHIHIHLFGMAKSSNARYCVDRDTVADEIFLGSGHRGIFEVEQQQTNIWPSITPTLNLNWIQKCYLLRYCTRVWSKRSFHAGNKQTNNVWVTSSHWSAWNLCVELTVTANPISNGMALGVIESFLLIFTCDWNLITLQRSMKQSATIAFSIDFFGRQSFTSHTHTR